MVNKFLVDSNIFAKKNNFKFVSLDSDFDKTDVQRVEPAEAIDCKRH